MPGCPLNDAELEYLVGTVAEQLQQGTAREQLITEISENGWAREEVAAFVAEVEARTQELGRVPRGCGLLCQSAGLQGRSGLLFAAAGGVATGGSLLLPDRALPILVVGSALLLYGLALFVRAELRLARYRS